MILNPSDEGDNLGIVTLQKVGLAELFQLGSAQTFVDSSG